MAVLTEKLKEEIKQYSTQRDQFLVQYHQLNGAIAVLQKQLAEIEKELEAKKKAEQGKDECQTQNDDDVEHD